MGSRSLAVPTHFGCRLPHGTTTTLPPLRLPQGQATVPHEVPESLRDRLRQPRLPHPHGRVLVAVADEPTVAQTWVRTDKHVRAGAPPPARCRLVQWDGTASTGTPCAPAQSA